MKKTEDTSETTAPQCDGSDGVGDSKQRDAWIDGLDEVLQDLRDENRKLKEALNESIEEYEEVKEISIIRGDDLKSCRSSCRRLYWEKVHLEIRLKEYDAK